MRGKNKLIFYRDMKFFIATKMKTKVISGRECKVTRIEKNEKQ